MKFALAILTLLLAACGRVDLPVHSAAQELRDAFVREANAHGVALTIDDVPLVLVGPVEGESTMAACLPSGQVVIAETWRNESAVYLEPLAFHEYGHCVLGLSHATDCAIDIMALDGVGHDPYWNNRDALLDELFRYTR